MTYLFPLIEGGRGEVLKINSGVGGEVLKINSG